MDIPQTIPLWAQLGMSAIFLILLVIVYRDGKQERAEMLTMITQLYERLVPDDEKKI